MKKYLIITVIALVAITGVLWKQLQDANEKWERAEGNVKAYASMFDSSKKQNAALLLTVDQLEYFQDSVLQELDATRKKLKIKDKNLKALQQVKSSFSKTDTITVTQVDTLFKEPTLAIDTLLGDEWYSLRLGLKYPSMIAVKPYFKSEKHIIVSSKKETVNSPKKFFLWKWLQRKHRVLQVDVVEKNPYVEGENSRYVEILK